MNWKNKIKFNSFYHLHIPKTGGRWLSSKIENNVLESFDYEKIKVINDRRALNINAEKERNGSNLKEYYEHTGWHSDINEKTFILTAFRDPVKQLCSLWTNSNEKYIYENGIKKELFLKDIQSDPSYLNNQSVSLSNSGRLKNFGMGMNSLDLDSLIKRIDRINHIILIQDKEIDYDKEISTMLKKMEINLSSKINEFQNGGIVYKNKNPMSRSLFNCLSDEEKNYISELQYIDTALYKRVIKKPLQ